MIPPAKGIRRDAAVAGSMVTDVTLADAGRSPVVAWRVEDGALVLRFSGSTDERALRCNCGRHHWIVETRHADGRAMLAGKCHGSGTTGAGSLVPGPPPLPREALRE